MARKAKKMAAVLAELYSDRPQPFLLTQKEFAALSGQGKMRAKFLRALEEFLKKRGYVLIDLHKERQIWYCVYRDHSAVGYPNDSLGRTRR